MATLIRINRFINMGQGVVLVILALALFACADSDSGGGSVPTAQTGALISGTVSGTRIVAVNSSDEVVAQDDTAGRVPNAQSQYAWSLTNLPIGTNLRIFFITGGTVYPLYFGNPSTNVFAVNNAGSIDLGHVTTAGNQATAQVPPTGVTPGSPNGTLPSSVAPTLTVSSPSNNASLPNGAVTIAFATNNFTIGAINQSHLHFFLDSDPVPYHFYSGSPGQVLYQNTPAANAQWLSNSQIRFPALAVGTHQVRLVLANSADLDLTNPDATKTIVFSVGASSGNPPTVTIAAPVQNGALPAGPVTVSFTTQFFAIGLPGQPHLHIYLNGDSTPYMFHAGAGIDVSNGVLYNGVHTHSMHWKTDQSVDIFGLSSAGHTVRLVLADAGHNELTNPDATKTVNFSVLSSVTGDLQLQSVLSGLNFPVGLAQAPDGRIFFNERLTGRVRIINPPNPQWLLQSAPFCQLTIATSGEQGLLGLALDPNFADPNNRFVYVYHSASSPLRNRVVRYTDSGGVCVNETIILDNLPASTNHNGGIILFGPDGKLYVVIGDAENTANSQNVTSLAGKVLRVNRDGSAPSDNPFFSNANANAQKVFSLGHRNSYGMTFHTQTGDLWETENGPADNDEINRIVPGGNYGWPTVRGVANNPNFRDPLLAYVSVIAPTGIISIPETSTVYPPAYRNNLLFTAWNDGRIRRMVLNGANLTGLGSSSTAFNGGQGGLLSLMLGTDGYVYVSNASAIFRVVPQ
ncbi:MAG: hypothetical protein HOP32_02770 [Nitrospira sp.]|nr:hypothetical protein [Nitrospira sp.]